MCQSHAEVRMGFTEERFPPGTHMCLIYSDEQERRSTISRFLAEGILAGERVAYFADMMSPGEVIDWLTESGVEIAGNGAAAQFSVSVAKDTYCPNGTFVPEEMLDTLRGFHKQLNEEGYRGGQIKGEAN